MFRSAEQSLTALITKSHQRKEYESNGEYFRRVASSWKEKYDKSHMSVYPLGVHKGANYSCVMVNSIDIAPKRLEVDIDITLKPYPTALQGQVDYEDLGGVGFTLSFQVGRNPPLFFGPSMRVALIHRTLFGLPEIVASLRQVETLILRAFLSDLRQEDIDRLHSDYPATREVLQF